MTLKEAVALIYNLVEDDITEASDQEYIQAGEVIKTYINE